MYFRKSNNYNCDFDINSMKLYMLPIDKNKKTQSLKETGYG